MRIRWLLLPALARAASHDMAAAVVREDPDAECRADCKTVHRRLHAQTLCAKRTRTLAAQKRSEASNSCLAAFNRGVTDECFDSFVAAANGAEWDRSALGRSDGRRLLPEARVDEAAPHRGLVEELHVAVRPAGKDGKVAVVPLVVDAVEIGVQE